MAQPSFPWRRTFILGFGFFGISIVCPIFNSFIPPMLEQLELTSLVIGFIMTWNNIINVCLTTDRGETNRLYRVPRYATSTP